MKRTIFVLLLALVVALSCGCSKKKETAETEGMKQETSLAGKTTPLMDPVSKEELDVMSTPYSYELDNVVYFFTSAENMEAFKANPQKYIAEMEVGGE